MSKFKDITGQRFGKVVALKRDPINGYKGQTRWICKCDCGQIISVTGGTLRYRKTVTCLLCRHAKLRIKEELCLTEWNQIIENAKKRNILVTVTRAQALQLFIQQDRKCTLSGLPISFGQPRRKQTTASLDRIDSSKGYTIDNIQWVHKTVNLMKNKLLNKDFIYFCNNVARYKSNNKKI